MTIARASAAQPCRVFALPGVPAEMFAMWRETVAPAILAAMQSSRRVTMHRRIKCFGAGESKLEAMLPDMIRRGREPRVGITVSDTTITLRITASGPDEAACRSRSRRPKREIRELLGVLVFGEEEDELQHAVVRLLNERRQTVAVAECATDGLRGPLARRRGRGKQHARGRRRAARSGVARRAARRSANTDTASAAAAEAMAQAIRERTGADFGLAVAALPARCQLLRPATSWTARCKSRSPRAKMSA